MKSRFLWLATVLTLPAVAQEPDWDAIEIRTTGLGYGIFLLQGLGGNIGMSAGEDGVFLIDDELAPLSQKVIAAVASISDDPVRFVINTHWHYDHVGANVVLGEAGAMIVSHDNARVRMAAQGPYQVPAGGLPVVTYSDTTTFHYNGHEIHAFHPMPAHTDGDSVIYFRDIDIIHMGDIFWNGLYPFIDTDSGGSVTGVVSTLRQIAEIAGPETQIIPGHGPLGDKAAVENAATMIEISLDRVGALVADGKGLEEVKAVKPLADYDETWGAGFITPDQWIETMYNAVMTR